MFSWIILAFGSILVKVSLASECLPIETKISNLDNLTLTVTGTDLQLQIAEGPSKYFKIFNVLKVATYFAIKMR